MSSNSFNTAMAEYLDCLDQGKEPNLDELIQKYPEHESKILAHINRERLLGGMFGEPDEQNTDLASLLKAGDRLADYEILSPVSSTAMGDVYRAKQTSLDRVVALKVMRPRGGNWSDRFKNESHIAATLHHNNIVRVHDSGFDSGLCFYSMEFIEGSQLDSWRSAAKTDWKAAASIMRKVANAVQYAHDQEVLHRDLKPSNILVDQDNEPHVTDFGLAKSLLSDMDMTSPSEVVGTPSFIAPEQIKGAEDSKLSDVYSLGATLYALLTGEPPFQGRTPAETLQQVLEGPLRAPRLIDSQVPADLETICLKCMDRHPEYRYRSAAELAAELQRFGIGQSIKARPIGVVGSSIRLARRNPLTTALLSVVSIGLLASPLVAVYLNQQRRLAVQGQERATKAVSELEQVSDFMQSVWHSADPYVNGKDLLASELLDDAIQQANDRFQEDPKIHAEVLLALGSNYHDLGFTDKAVEVLQESVNCYEKSHGPKSQKTLLAQGRLAVSLLYDSKNEQASELIDTATETWLSSYPRDADYDQLEAARITILMEDDEYESAIALRREAIERAIVRDGEDSRKVRAQQLQLAMALIECEEFKKAENLVSNVIQLCDKDQSTKEILYADALGLMGRIRRAEENRTQAIEYQTQALELRVELLGEDHWESLRGMKSLALSMQRAQRLDGMLELLERRAAAAYRRYGPNHRESVSASIDVMLKNPDPAMRVEGYESVLPRMLVAYGEDDRQVLAVKQTAAQAYIFSGKPIEASRILREILPKVIDAFGPYHRNTLRTQLVLATAISEASNVSDSIAFLEDVYESHVQELGPDHASSVDLLCNMANYACRGESFDNAKLWAKKAISICDSLENQPQYSPRRADMQLVLAESNLAEDDNDSTIKNAMTSHDVFSRSGSPNIFLAHAEALMSLASAKAGDANQSRTQAEKAHVTLGNLSENRSDAWRRTRAEELLSLVTDFASATNSQEIENP